MRNYTVITKFLAFLVLQTLILLGSRAYAAYADVAIWIKAEGTLCFEGAETYYAALASNSDITFSSASAAEIPDEVQLAFDQWEKEHLTLYTTSPSAGDQRRLSAVVKCDANASLKQTVTWEVLNTQLVLYDPTHKTFTTPDDNLHFTDFPRYQYTITVSDNALQSIGWGIYPEDKYRSKPSKKASIWKYFNELISGLFSKSQVE